MRINRKIRVLAVDDSIMFREVLVRGLSKDPAIEVVGVAADPYEARDKIIELAPDVLTLDIEMPKMSGVEFLKKLMPQYPLPVVVVSGINNTIFDALKAGAVDFVDKPDASRQGNMESFINEMIIKIKIASTAKVGRFKTENPVGGPSGTVPLRSTDTMIAIGASTGGTEATLEVIRNLPRETPGIVIVQHMPPMFTKMYADRLNNVCRIAVKEAQDGDAVTAGTALVAPGGKQLRLVRGRSGGYAIKVFDGDKVNGHAPSVDVLFESVAEVVGRDALGVILTGMGNDGARGLLTMRQKGAYTIGQDEKSCVVYGMPMVAFNIGAVVKQAPLNLISNEILRYLKEKN